MKFAGQRLREIRKNRKISQEELAGTINSSRPSISNWERGVVEPDTISISKIANALNTSVSYLMGETDNPMPIAVIKEQIKPEETIGIKIIRNGIEYTEAEISAMDAEKSRAFTQRVETNHDTTPETPLAFKNIIYVPVISNEVSLCAGNGNCYTSDIEWTSTGTFPISDGELSAFYDSKDLLCMNVEGDSMEPQIHDGDMVLFNRSHEWTSGSIYAVCLDGKLLIKGLFFDGVGKPPLLKSQNKDYPDIHINEDSFFLVYGKVLRVFSERRVKPMV